MITQTINLNLIPGSLLPRINVSQYDNGSRTLQFNLYNGVSPYEIHSGASVYIVGTKADNTGFEYACTYNGSLVSVDITDQMTVFAGEVQSELQIRQSGKILGTANFIINVEAAALSDDTQISETDIPIIQRIPEILEEAEEYADTAHKWATFGADTETPSSTNNAKYWAEQSQVYAVGSAIASNEPTTTSSRAYSVGQYMMRNGNLKKVTSAIASGESITGNNTSNTTVGEELTHINSNLSAYLDHTTQIGSSNTPMTPSEDCLFCVYSRSASGNIVEVRDGADLMWFGFIYSDGNNGTCSPLFPAKAGHTYTLNVVSGGSYDTHFMTYR